MKLALYAITLIFFIILTINFITIGNYKQSVIDYEGIVSRYEIIIAEKDAYKDEIISLLRRARVFIASVDIDCVRQRQIILTKGEKYGD